VSPTAIQIVGAVLFALAIAHTFATKYFEHMAVRRPTHAGLWHLLGEIEVVFGFWALLLMLCMFTLEGSEKAIAYIDDRNMTEPLFVFAVMVVAGTRPIRQTATRAVLLVARILPTPGSTGFYFAVLAFAPLLGSFITEPAAMTLAAMMLSERIFSRPVSMRLKYATLGVLFVNVSIGGTMTPFAAPPVLMVAGQWGWDSAFMLSTFGWKAAAAVGLNALGATLLFRKELAALPIAAGSARPPAPLGLVLAHIAFLAGVVVFAHHPTIFMGLFLFFLGVAGAYKHHQDRLILREGLLVAFFLAGLVVLGGLQQWWLKPLLLSLQPESVFYGSALLTAFTDNAALTYLGSQVDGLSDAFKYALVSGAVTGGGLTIIANAPNPAGISILRGHFEDSAVNPLGLFAAAFAPTCIAVLAFQYL